MRILEEDYKNHKFIFVPESNDDLFMLSLMINKGDVVEGYSYRKVKLEKESVKKKIYVKLYSEKINFYGNILKIIGLVMNEIEDVPKGSYHSLNIMNNDRITVIKKDITKYFLSKIEEIKKKKYTILIVLFDINNLLFAELTNNDYKIINEERIRYGGKYYKKDERGFYNKIVEKIKLNIKKDYDLIIVGCPSIFQYKIKEYLSEIGSKIKILNIHEANENGIKEILVSNELKLDEIKLIRDEQILNELKKRIAKNDKVIYGLNEIRNISNTGVIETLIISESLVHEMQINGNYEILEEIMTEVDRNNGKVIILNKKSSKELDAISGIAALLRYQLF